MSKKLKAKDKRLIKQSLDLFLKKKVPMKLINYWFTEEWEKGYEYDLQCFVNDNLKKKFLWQTGIGLIEACIKMVDEAKINGNI